MLRNITVEHKAVNIALSVALALGLLPTFVFACENDYSASANSDTTTFQTDTVGNSDNSKSTESVNDSNSGDTLFIEANEAAITLANDWTQSGTCEWQIDGDGKLTIRPLGNGETGTLGNWSSGKAPWYSQSESIKSVVFAEGVAAQTCFEMFFGCSLLTSVDFSGLDTSQVTDMYGLFMGCSSLKSINWAKFDTSAAKSTALMFCGCTSLPAINVSSFDTSLITRMGGMFYNCTSLKTLDLSSFDTSNVESMTTMFYGCSSLTSLDVSSFNTAKVVDMSYMFDGCTSLTSVDLSSFDTSSVTETTGMFLDCSNLKTASVSYAFSMAKITQSDGMFANCTSLVGGAGTVYDASCTDDSRACIDGGEALPGYLTLKRQVWEGDVNSNGKLTIVDAQIAYDIAVTHLYEDWPNYNDMKKRADVDWNGTVDASDAYAIQYASLCGWKS